MNDGNTNDDQIVESAVIDEIADEDSGSRCRRSGRLCANFARHLLLRLSPCSSEHDERRDAIASFADVSFKVGRP